MTSFLKMGVLATALVGAQLSAAAGDLDVFTSGPSANAADLPNVLFVIDNTANWNQSFSSEMAALKDTLLKMPENKYNVGFMLGTEMGGANGGQQGGYVRAAIRPMNAANRAKYVALIERLDKLMDKSSGGNSSLQIAEAWAYFSGGKAFSGNFKTKTDYTGNTTGLSTDAAVHALPGNALPSYAGTQYTSPLGAGSCAKNFIVYISNGPNQASTSSNAMSNQLLAAAGGSAATAQIPLSPSSSMANPADEWTRFMKQSYLGIVTYAIDVNPTYSGQGPGWTALLKSMAGPNYVAVTNGNDSVQIAVAIGNTLSKIQSVNSVFAAVSLPASPNVQDAYLNQLYVGMFRADPNARPRWMGNLKQYQGASDGTLLDADGAHLINSLTGFISECARSYWTADRSMPDNYWALDPKGACIPPPGADNFLYASSNTPDGNIVEKGAQAYALRSQDPGARKVMTCATPDCVALTDMSPATVPATTLGAVDANEQAALINWARGANVDAELDKATAAMRPSAHGDVVHSKPLALSYGDDVVVYYGSNDGMLRAINGNRTNSLGGVTAGSELWAFMPPEFFGNLKRLRANTEPVSMAAPSGLAATGSAKPYSFDGPITAYQGDAGGTWLFAGMRRGGRAVYAFDVSDKMAPALKWRAGCAGADDSFCTPGASALGQTWSAPIAVRTTAYRGGAAPLLIMGGGYDNCEDTDQHSCTGASRGHNITVMDADSGAIVNVLNTERGVVGDVRIVTGADGLGKYAYAADLGGNLYRIDLGALTPQEWRIVKVASLGCATADTACSNRKFMYAPSVVAEADGSISLYLGSGDREKPLGAAYYPSTAAVANYFFKVIDKPEDPSWLASEMSNCAGQAVVCLNSLSAAGGAQGTCGGVQASDKKGWYLGLRPTEQVVTLAATRFGVTTFSTHMPTVYQIGSCTSNLGTVHVYNLDVGSAEPASGTTCGDVVTGGGLPPSPQKMDVCMDAACSLKQPMCIGCSAISPLQMQPSAAPVAPAAYWYLK